jgi:uncharacterized protein YyaL (SSP411 family)
VAGALLSYSALTGSDRHRDAAISALGVLPPIASRYPRAAGWGLAVAEALLSGPAEIAIIGPRQDSRTVALHETALRAAPPGAVIAVGEDLGELAGDAAELGEESGERGEIPLLAGRRLVDGAPAAYVCRNFTCRAPVTDPEQLRAALRP